VTGARAVTSVIFDMDGLLIDTEPVWRTAEVAVLAIHGVQLSRADVIDSTGQEIGEVVAGWLRRLPGQYGADSPDAVAVTAEITDLVISHVAAEGEPMAGVPEAIALFERCGLRLAIASSSPPRLIDAVCRRLGLDRISVRCSAASEARGKPTPDVYLTAARRLGEDPVRCLALEDCVAGVTAAKAAGMRCIAVPDPQLAGDPGYSAADLVLGSLTQLGEPDLADLGMRPSTPSGQPHTTTTLRPKGTDRFQGASTENSRPYPARRHPGS
jgi:sugar-phosphatase